MARVGGAGCGSGRQWSGGVGGAARPGPGAPRAAALVARCPQLCVSVAVTALGASPPLRPLRPPGARSVAPGRVPAAARGHGHQDRQRGLPGGVQPGARRRLGSHLVRSSPLPSKPPPRAPWARGSRPSSSRDGPGVVPRGLPQPSPGQRGKRAPAVPSRSIVQTVLLQARRPAAPNADVCVCVFSNPKGDF